MCTAADLSLLLDAYATKRLYVGELGGGDWVILLDSTMEVLSAMDSFADVQAEGKKQQIQ